ncbi:hypothetical protein [Roseateles sp. LKC17W]|uniref:Uncharacterized protein n=1 Tax=Pelomonas margarita TaxID=3299031 RepID=A0ABW7FFY2_9BURK
MRAATVRPGMRDAGRTSEEYAIYGMSRAAWLMQRDLADWDFSKANGLSSLFCDEYESAVRYQARQLIAKGC